MPGIIPPVPAELSGFLDEADLIEKLVASGAITETERKQLLDQFWTEHQADRESTARRAQFTPNVHPQEEGEIMNANDIITQIEQTHSVMSAQVRKLNEFSPSPFPMPATEAGGTGGLADLLHATVAGHVTNAADSLRAIASVEADMSAPASKTSVTDPISTPRTPQVIEAELGE